MKKKITIAVIGCGVIAPTHIKSFQQHKDTEVKWACDLIEDKARRLAQSHAIECITQDYREPLNDRDVDCVAICTDHSSHSPIAVDALDAGKHVLCEKALGATREGMDAMCAAHKRSPELVFSGVFQHRFDHSIRTLRRAVSDGALGTLLNAGVQLRCLRTDEYYHGDAWRGTWQEEGGSVLINQSIHFIDALLWIVGGASQVCGAYANITHAGAIETEDCAAAALRLNCGALGTLEATSSSHLGWEPTLSLHGVRGSIEIRNGDLIKSRFENPDDAEMLMQELECGEQTKGVMCGKDYYGTGHPAQIADFLDAVRKGGEPFISGEDARHAVDVVLGIYDSHEKNRWVSVRKTTADAVSCR